MDLLTAVNQYVKDPAANLNTDQSRSSYRRDLQTFAYNHPGLALEDVTEDHLVAWVSQPHVASATIVSRRTRVCGLMGWAHFRGHTQVDVSTRMKRIVRVKQQPVMQHHWLSEAEVAHVLDSIGSDTDWEIRNLIIARLGFTVGMRRAEIGALTWGQVNLDNQQLFFTGKGRKSVTVWINDSTTAVLREWHDRYPDPQPTDPVIVKFRHHATFDGEFVLTTLWGEQLDGRSIGDVVKKIANGAGTVFRPHDMRRSFAGILQDRGVPIEDISAALRHSNIGTTQRYLETRQDAAYQAVKSAGLDL